MHGRSNGDESPHYRYQVSVLGCAGSRRCVEWARSSGWWPWSEVASCSLLRVGKEGSEFLGCVVATIDRECGHTRRMRSCDVDRRVHMQQLCVQRDVYHRVVATPSSGSRCTRWSQGGCAVHIHGNDASRREETKNQGQLTVEVR